MNTGRGITGVMMVLVMAFAWGQARAQGVVLANSDPLVTIHSTFTGQTITLFGNIEPGQGAVPGIGPYDVVILLRGPASDRVVRVRERQFGLILNADHAIYRHLPGYYSVLSSRPLADVLASEALDDPLLSLSGLAALARAENGSHAFDAELIRLMREAGLFIEAERGVSFLSPTTFSARIPLPSSVPNGLYVAQAHVIAGGEVVASGTTSFNVRTEGFERFVSRTAATGPLLYGITAVIIAIAAGWIGGILFRR